MIKIKILFIIYILIMFLYGSWIYIEYTLNIDYKALPNKQPKNTIMLGKKMDITIIPVIKLVLEISGNKYLRGSVENVLRKKHFNSYDIYIEDHEDFYIYVFNWMNKTKHLTIMKDKIILN